MMEDTDFLELRGDIERAIGEAQDANAEANSVVDSEPDRWFDEFVPAPQEVPGTGTGLEIRGEKKLYLTPVLREYDAEGELVDVGDETGGEGTSLHLTYDLNRFQAVDE